MANRRVDQLLSSLGYCTRREAQALCDQGRVQLDGAPVGDASARVDPSRLRVDDQPVDPVELLLRFHKPLGTVCSHDEGEGPTIYQLLPERWRRREPKVVSIGRLDKDTSGLLLLTDVGPLVQRFTSPKRHVDKVYEATLDGPVTAAHVEAFAAGIQLEGEEAACLPARLRPLEGHRAEVTLQEGRYHQVRRMFAACGLKVLELHRPRFGAYSLDGLEPGAWELLSLP